MKSLIAGIFFTIFLFSLCYFLCVLPLLLKAKPSTKPEEITAEKEPKPLNKVYYLTERKPRRRRASPKGYSVGLKGALVPEGTVVVTSRDILERNSPKNKPTTKRSPHKTAASTKKQGSAQSKRGSYKGKGY